MLLLSHRLELSRERFPFWQHFYSGDVRSSFQRRAGEDESWVRR